MIILSCVEYVSHATYIDVKGTGVNFLRRNALEWIGSSYFFISFCSMNIFWIHYKETRSNLYYFNILFIYYIIHYLNIIKVQRQQHTSHNYLKSYSFKIYTRITLYLFFGNFSSLTDSSSIIFFLLRCLLCTEVTGKHNSLSLKNTVPLPQK